MELRVFTEPQQGASYERLLDIARAAERLGFGAFFRSDHYRKMGGADPSAGYTDAWITLAGLARDTASIRLGTLVSPPTFRQLGTFPIVAAQVDHMSGGRLEIGLGGGWFADEHAAYGIPFPEPRGRYDLLEDQLAILDGVWGAPLGSTFSYEGKTRTVTIEVDPLRPAQLPHPPIVMGGHGGPRNAALVARHATEFNCDFVDVAEMRRRQDAIRAACVAQGRDPDSLIYSVALVVCCGRDDVEIARRARAIGRDVHELAAHGLCGRPGEVVERARAYASAGASRCYLQILDLADLEHLELIAAEVMPHL